MQSLSLMLTSDQHEEMSQIYSLIHLWTSMRDICPNKVSDLLTGPDISIHAHLKTMPALLRPSSDLITVSAKLKVCLQVVMHLSHASR